MPSSLKVKGASCGDFKYLLEKSDKRLSKTFVGMNYIYSEARDFEAF